MIALLTLIWALLRGKKVEVTVIDDKPVDPVIEDVNGGRFMWCLDNGHGRLQAGKRSPVFDGTQFFEWEFNYDIVQRIAKGLTERGINFFIVVPDAEEVGSFLTQRVERANNLESNLPKIYVSVHSNASKGEGWYPPEGIETYHYEGSAWGKKLAEVFQRNLTASLPWRDRGVKTNKTWVVLKKTEMPAILTENGFYNNLSQVKELMKEEVRAAIADAHIHSIVEVETSENFKWGK